MEGPKPSTSKGILKQNSIGKLEPRQTQYEPNSLLQERACNGLTEIESFLLERGADKLNVCVSEDVCDIPDKMTSKMIDDNKEHPISETGFKQVTPLNLTPRGAHLESHPLFERKGENMSAIEEYLTEASANFNSDKVYQQCTCCNKNGCTCVITECSEKSDNNENGTKSKNIGELKLQPRTAHYEINSLLETKDASGMSDIQKYLKEKETMADEQSKDNKRRDSKASRKNSTEKRSGTCGGVCDEDKSDKKTVRFARGSSESDMKHIAKRMSMTMGKAGYHGSDSVQNSETKQNKKEKGCCLM